MIFQIGTALLDTCVLSVLIKEDRYGYNLTQTIKDVINISESTLYPVLRRLEKEKYLTTYDQAYQGRNRRYYQITAVGKEKLEEYRREWEKYKEKVDKILGGDHENE